MSRFCAVEFLTTLGHRERNSCRRRPAGQNLRSRRLTSVETEIVRSPAAKIAIQTAYFGSTAKIPVCEGWVVETVGLELGTHHPVIEPVSA